MPINVDIVDVGKMSFQITTLFAFVVALVAGKPFNVDIMLVGKMPFQIAMMFAFVFAHVAIRPLNVDVVLVGKMFFQLSTDRQTLHWQPSSAAPWPQQTWREQHQKTTVTYSRRVTDGDSWLALATQKLTHRRARAWKVKQVAEHASNESNSKWE